MKVELMRLAGRIIALIITVFGGVMLIGEAVGDYLEGGWAAIAPPTPADAGLLLVIIGVVALVGCILSWWRERAAGIVLIAVSAALGAHIGVFAARGHMLAWSMLGLPYLVAGVLLLNSWRLSQELA